MGSATGARVGSLRTRSELELRAPGAHPVRLLYADSGDRWYVIASEPTATWAVRALEAGGCEVRLGPGAWSRCAVRRVDDPLDQRAVRAAFEAKYGGATWERHFAVAGTFLELDRRAVAGLGAGALLAQGVFDDVASSYESRHARRPLERALKARVLEDLLRAFDGTDPVLEIGPGVGLETVPLLEAGHHVTAVDLSPRMLEVLRERAARAGVDDRLTARSGSLAQLGDALADAAPGAFGAAFSTFGAFSLEPDLSRVGADLGRLVRPGGQLMFTSLNRPGPMPLAWELLQGQLRSAGARLRPRVPAGVDRYALPVHLRRPSDWDRALAPWFARRRALAVSVIAPPYEPGRPSSFLSGPGAARLLAWDRWLGRRPLLAEFGEWSLLEYVRAGPPTPGRSVAPDGWG